MASGRVRSVRSKSPSWWMRSSTVSSQAVDCSIGAGSSGAIAARCGRVRDDVLAAARRDCGDRRRRRARSSAERDAAEDDVEAGARDVATASVTAADAVLGVSASGRTPFVVGAVETAAAAGALTGAVVSAPDSPLAALVDHEILVVVGPEFLAGSTRLKSAPRRSSSSTPSRPWRWCAWARPSATSRSTSGRRQRQLRTRVRRIVEVATGASPDEVEPRSKRRAAKPRSRLCRCSRRSTPNRAVSWMRPADEYGRR